MKYEVGSIHKFTKSEFIRLAKQGLIAKDPDHDVYFLYSSKYKDYNTRPGQRVPGFIFSSTPDDKNYVDHIKGYYDIIESDGVIIVRPPQIKAYNKGLS